MPAFYSHHACQPRALDQPGLVPFPSPSKLVRSFPSPATDAGEDVSFASVDSARLRNRATSSYAESIEAARHGLWTSAVVTGGAALEAILLDRILWLPRCNERHAAVLRFEELIEDARSRGLISARTRLLLHECRALRNCVHASERKECGPNEAAFLHTTIRLVVSELAAGTGEGGR